jgi:sugar phosphate isomerase/epimerase
MMPLRDNDAGYLSLSVSKGRNCYFMFISLNPGTLSFSVPLDEALQLAKANKFTALDLPLAELWQLAQESSVQSVKERFEEAGIRPGGWGLPVDFRRSEELYQEGLAKLPGYAALAQALGSPWCSTWILPFSDELDYDANMEVHVRRLRPIAQILADHGCRFGLEFVGPKTMRDGHKYAFIATIDGGLELGRQIGTGNTGLLLDCWHWYTSHGTVADLERLSVEQIVYVHVNDAVAGRAIDEQIDNQRLLAGASGVIDIASFLQVLARKGYDGPVVVEPFDASLNALTPAERVRVTRESLSKIWAQAGLSE